MRALFVRYGTEKQEIHTSVHVGVPPKFNKLCEVRLTGGRN
jgi:hypothetical protein